MGYIVPKKLDDALSYFKKNGYKRLALKDGNYTVVLPFNSMQEGEFDNKIREIKNYFNDVSFPAGIYYISGQKSPRSGTSFEIPVQKSDTYALRANGNPYATFNSLYGNTSAPTNLVEENQLLKERLAQIEASLEDDDEDDPFMSLLNEHGPQLMEMGKMIIEGIINKNKPAASSSSKFTPVKKKISVSDIRNMPNGKERDAAILALSRKRPDLLNKL
jgi:hypothetical protein